MQVKTPYHNYFFLFGFFYYLVGPVIIAEYGIISNNPGGHLLDNVYDSTYNLKYFVIISLWFVSFYTGSFFISFFSKKQNKYIKGTTKMDVLYFLTPVIFLFCFLLFLKYPAIKTGNVNEPIIGFTCTLILILSFLIIYNNTQGYKFTKHKILIILYLYIFLFLLRSGTRMYFLIPVIMCLTHAREQAYLSARKLSIIIFTLSIIILFVGIWRVGITDLNMLTYIFFAEPTFTWISAETFLSNDPNFAIPYNFFSSLINIIPKFILPNKSEIIVNIPFYYESPLGATSVFASLIGNFGIFGSTIFLFIVGAVSSIIFLKTNHRFIYVYYLAYCAILPFQFFRDSFGIINKVIFTAFFIYPLIIISCAKICGKLLNNAH